MEQLALDGAVLEDAPLRLVELVEARDQQRPQRRRHLELAALRREREHLGDEERVPAGPRGDASPQVVGKGEADQRVGLGGRERLEPQRRRPRGTTVEELGARGAQEEQRRAGREERRRLDEVEERLLTPLQVVEANDERGLLLEQLAERPRDLVRARLALALAEQGSDRRRPDLVRRKRIELLHHLDDGPVGDPVSVREAPAGHDPRRLELGDELGDEPRLADTSLAHDGQHLAAPVGHGARPRIPQPGQLGRATDEPGFVRALRRLAHTDEPVRRHGRALPLQLQWGELLHAHRAACQSPRHLADHDLPRRRRLLEPRSHVDRVTRRQPFRGSGHDLARVDADPPFDPELGEGLAHLQRRPQRPHRIVLVHDRHAEHRHHGVPDELLDGSAVPLDDRLHPLEVAREERPQRLGVGRLAERRRPDDVAEEDRDRLPLLARDGRLRPRRKRHHARRRGVHPRRRRAPPVVEPDPLLELSFADSTRRTYHPRPVGS